MNSSLEVRVFVNEESVMIMFLLIFIYFFSFLLLKITYFVHVETRFRSYLWIVGRLSIP